MTIWIKFKITYEYLLNVKVVCLIILPQRLMAAGVFLSWAVLGEVKNFVQSELQIYNFGNLSNCLQRVHMYIFNSGLAHY